MEIKPYFRGSILSGIYPGSSLFGIIRICIHRLMSSRLSSLCFSSGESFSPPKCISKSLMSSASFGSGLGPTEITIPLKKSKGLRVAYLDASSPRERKATIRGFIAFSNSFPSLSHSALAAGSWKIFELGVGEVQILMPAARMTGWSCAIGYSGTSHPAQVSSASDRDSAIFSAFLVVAEIFDSRFCSLKRG